MSAKQVILLSEFLKVQESIAKDFLLERSLQKEKYDKIVMNLKEKFILYVKKHKTIQK